MFAIGDREWPGISKLIEEAGEVVQVCGKLMGTRGDTRHWDGDGDLKTRLEDEMSDLMAAIVFVAKKCGLDEDRMFRRTMEKTERFESWHAKGEPVC